MKIKTTQLYFWKLVFGIVLITGLFSSKAVSQGTVTFSQPGYSMNYNALGNAWVHQSNSTFTYNAAGQVLEEIKQDPFTNQNTFRTLFTYDANGTEKRRYTYNWQNGNWNLINGYRDSLIYTPANNIASRTTVVYSNNQWKNWTYEKFIYDASNNLTEEDYSDWDATTNSWQPYYKNNYSYDTNGLKTQKQQSNYQNGSWSVIWIETYNSWHIPNVLPASSNSTIFSNGIINRRNTITLGPNGSTTDLYEGLSSFTNTWNNIRRTTTTKDLRGNITNILNEGFSNGAWQVQREHQIILTYNSAFDITEKIIRHPDFGTQNGSPVKDQNKYVYSNFQYFAQALGTTDPQQSDLALRVYPNPATNKIQIKLTEQKPQALTAIVKDITGKTWQTQTFKAAETTQLNIEALPKGIYLLQLQTESGSTVKRIVKQ